MRQEEYITTVVYKNRMINVGLDDPGQQFFLEYVDDNGQLKEFGCGAYNSDYNNVIKYLFGDK